MPRRAAHPDLAALRRPGTQPSAGYREEDRDPAGKDQGGFGTTAQVESPPRLVVRHGQLPVCRARLDRRARRAWRLPSPPRGRVHSAVIDLARLPETAAEQAN